MIGIIANMKDYLKINYFILKIVQKKKNFIFIFKYEKNKLL